MITTILFDLDGTLLPMDFDEYLARYLAALGRRLARVIPPDQVGAVLKSATMTMVANDGADDTLSSVFWGVIGRAAGATPAEVRARIGEDDFYRDDVASLRGTIPVPASSRSLVQTAIDAEYEVVLATNPVFPREVITQRADWAGLSNLPWKLVTSYESMHFAKPNPRYYREVLDRIGRRPADCVMVGNDTRDDLAAITVGVRAFLLEGHVIERPDALVPTWRGSLDSLRQLIIARFADPDIATSTSGPPVASSS